MIVHKDSTEVRSCVQCLLCPPAVDSWELTEYHMIGLQNLECILYTYIIYNFYNILYYVISACVKYT